MQPLPRIVMLIWKFHPLSGGAENQCYRLSTELAKRGHSVTVITHKPHRAAPRERLGGFEVARVPVPVMPGRIADAIYKRILSAFPALVEGSPPRGSLRFRLHRLLRYLRGGFAELLPRYTFMIRGLVRLAGMRGRYDVLHVHEAHWISALGVLASRLASAPCIVKQANWREGGSLVLQPWPYRALARRAETIVAISQAIALELRESGIPEARIARIPNGIEVPSRRWTGGDPGRMDVVFVGNLTRQPNKGIDILLNAWKGVPDIHPRARLQILGEGDGFELKALARTLGIQDSVTFMGSRRDVPDILLQSRLFVLPSRVEGMSNALLEAMSLGLPCIATDVSGSQDLVDDGETGILVPAEDPQGLRDAIARLLGDPGLAARLGAGARRKIEAGFTLSEVADAYGRLYARLRPTREAAPPAAMEAGNVAAN